MQQRFDVKVLDQAIKKVPNFPKEGILFYDITSIFINPPVYRMVIEEMLARYQDQRVDGVVAIESRGFLLGSCFALERQVPMVLARKKGKLPRPTIGRSYSLEYGNATLEMHQEDLLPGRHWLIVDDLIATGGTLDAVARMIEESGSYVAGIFSIVGLPFLNYAKKIGQYKPITLIDYHGE
ncbi:MAG: adenine phosphoribosyltransferase [Oligoflexia bacterium]|nr:adenine phosphoribosyltransferase [Oligoflexia bacterium]